MLITTIKLGETSIEFHNSIWGKETVKVNGEVVSSKFSLGGMSHVFKVNEEGKESTYMLKTGLGTLGLSLNLYKDDEAIIFSPASRMKYALLIFILFFAVIVFYDKFIN